MPLLAQRFVQFVFLSAILAVCVSASGQVEPQKSQEDIAKEAASIPWQNGPFKGTVGSKATVDVPENARFLAQGKTDKFFELTGNLPHPGATVIVLPNGFAVFGFADSGYIKDDEKIDADALLKSLKDGDEDSNAERAKRGLQKLHTLGWAVAPHYDSQSKHLEWGVKLQAEGEQGYDVNYTVRLLGRTGYESVTLVASPEKLDAGIADLRKLLNNFEFNSGERYAEFREGDKVAEYGLAALVVGGAAAVAAKTGFWKVILAALAASWKLVLGGLLALGAGIKKIFSRKST